MSPVQWVEVVLMERTGARGYKDGDKKRNTEPQNTKRSFPISGESDCYHSCAEGSEAALLGSACFQAYLSLQTGVQIT